MARPGYQGRALRGQLKPIPFGGESCMSNRTVAQGNVVLVEHDPRGGLVLERALTGRGWSVNRLSSGRAFAAWEDPDAIVLVLDQDDTDIFDTLARLSALARRPAVIVMTKRSNAHALD